MNLYERYIKSITVAKNKVLVCTKVETSQVTVRRIVEDKYRSTIGKLILAEGKRFIFQISDNVEKKKSEVKVESPKVSESPKAPSPRTRKTRSRRKTTKGTDST